MPYPCSDNNSSANDILGKYWCITTNSKLSMSNFYMSDPHNIVPFPSLNVSIRALSLLKSGFATNTAYIYHCTLNIPLSIDIVDIIISIV